MVVGTAVAAWGCVAVAAACFAVGVPFCVECAAGRPKVAISDQVDPALVKLADVDNGVSSQRKVSRS